MGERPVIVSLFFFVIFLFLWIAGFLYRQLRVAFRKIYRIDGALVFAGIARDNTPINIETLAAGSYVVQAAANGTTVFTSRLLKRD